MDDVHPAATRTVSMPTDDSSRSRANAFRTRSAYRKRTTKDKEQDRPSTPPGRSRRFLMRLKRRSKDVFAASDTLERASIDVIRGRRSSVHRVSPSRAVAHRNTDKMDRIDRIDRTDKTAKTESPTTKSTTKTASQPTPTTNNRSSYTYTVIDRTMPSHVVQGDAHFATNTWNQYNHHIDQLAEDPQFMHYLTQPLQQRSPRIIEPKAHAEAQQLAVNKLYPLAFIRLLEAHAKGAAESAQPCDPADELHRYDDVDDRDVDRVVRTHSNGLYHIGRFRTVGGERWSGTYRKSTYRESAQGTAAHLTRLIQAAPSRQPAARYSFAGMSRGNQFASVPVY